MNIKSFLKLFPATPFYLHRVERGAHRERKFIWHARFTSDYFTSDTDRLVDNHKPPHGYTDAFGDTVEECLEDLAQQVLKNMESSTAHYQKGQREAEGKLSEFRQKLLEAKAGGR
jgi:hypothetical protein